MKTININNWKEFKVGDLFDIHPTKHYNDNNGKALPNRDLFDEDGINPVIVNSAYNNGVGGYTNKPCNEKGGIITFSDTTTSDAIFYQEDDFVGYSHVQGMYPIKYNEKWSKYSMKFFEVIFHSRANTLGYNFINKFTRDLASCMVVKLPTKLNKYNEDEPDWEYMESYMKNIMENSKITIRNLLKINDKKNKIDTKNWKKFKIGDLFIPLKTGYIEQGKKIGSATKTPDKEHTIPLTCAKFGNNGIMYWGKKGDFITHSNVLAVIRDGAVATGMVYAEKEETGVYSHSYFIKLKDYDVSFYVNLYLSCILTKTIYPKYTREDTCIWDRIKKDEILLPVNSLGIPDWEYIETYMCNIEQQVQNNLNKLQLILK